MESSLPRLRGLTVSARAFRGLSLANALMLIVIMATGATVRLTASGLGCRHWPGCTAGDPFPESGAHSFIEFSNRIVAAVTIVVTLVTWLASRLAPSAAVRTRRLALATFVGTFAQAPLGAITVYFDLNPYLVQSHFLVSILVLTLGVLVALDAWRVRPEHSPPLLRRFALVVGAAAAVLIVTGTIATGAGPHPGSKDVPRLWSLQSAVWLHVRATAVFAIGFAVLVIWLAMRGSHAFQFGMLVLAVLGIQMAVGEIQFHSKLPSWLVLIHVVLAAALWASTAALVAVLLRRTDGSRIA